MLLLHLIHFLLISNNLTSEPSTLCHPNLLNHSLLLESTLPNPQKRLFKLKDLTTNLMIGHIFNHLAKDRLQIIILTPQSILSLTGRELSLVKTKRPIVTSFSLEISLTWDHFKTERISQKLYN